VQWIFYPFNTFSHWILNTVPKFTFVQFISNTHGQSNALTSWGSYWMLCPPWIECTDKQLGVNPWKCVACSDMAFWQCCSVLLCTFHSVTQPHGTCVMYRKKHGFNEAHCNCNCFTVISVIWSSPCAVLFCVHFRLVFVWERERESVRVCVFLCARVRAVVNNNANCVISGSRLSEIEIFSHLEF